MGLMKEGLVLTLGGVGVEVRGGGDTLFTLR